MKRIVIFIILLSSYSVNADGEKTKEADSYLQSKKQLLDQMTIDGAKFIKDHIEDGSKNEPSPNELFTKSPCNGIDNALEIHHFGPKANRFDKVRAKLLSYCAMVLAGPFSTNCHKIIQDVFDVGSPYCAEGDSGDSAGSCVMGLKYLVNRFQSNKPKYQMALQNLDTLIDSYANKTRPIDFNSFYDIALKAAEGDRFLAIELMAMENLGHAGLKSFINELKDFPEDTIAILNKLDKNGSSIFDTIANAYPNKKFRAIPKRHQNKVNKGKEYHYWARALMSSGLIEKGYPSLVARQISTMTSAVYELYFDWNEHLAEGDSMGTIASAAFNDILLSDCGSELGSRVSAPLFSPDCIGPQF